MPSILDLPETRARAISVPASPAAILDLPEVRARVSPLSVEAYEALVKWESSENARNCFAE